MMNVAVQKKNVKLNWCTFGLAVTLKHIFKTKKNSKTRASFDAFLIAQRTHLFFTRKTKNPKKRFIKLSQIKKKPIDGEKPNISRNNFVSRVRENERELRPKA
jgi:hypothetical protein